MIDIGDGVPAVKIIDLLKAGKTYSFEFMPPRTEEREAQLEKTLEELEPLRPSFVSITYGAGGSTRDRTHELVTRLLRKSTMTPMAHLTCAAHSRAELVEILQRYVADGVVNLLALRGDPPLNSTEVLPEGELKHAVDLVELAHELGDFSVAVAAHPQGHPACSAIDEDRKHLAAKLRSADFAITQFFFEVDEYKRLVEDLASLGVDKPVLPGIMPPTNLKQLSKMAELSGAPLPGFVAERLTEAKTPADARAVGVDIATELSAELLAFGAPGLHFYTMNKSTATREIYRNLGLSPAT